MGTTTYLGFLPSSVRLLCHPRNCFPPPSLPRETRPPLSLLLIPRDHDLNTGTAGHHHHHREHSRELLIAAPSIALTRGLSRLTRARFPPTLAFGPHDPRDHFSARTTRRSNLPVLPPTPSTYRVTRHFPRRPKKRPQPPRATQGTHPVLSAFRRHTPIAAFAYSRLAYLQEASLEPRAAPAPTYTSRLTRLRGWE